MYGNFYFDDKYSGDFNVLPIELNSGLSQRVLMGSASISETEINSDFMPVFNKVKRSPFSFPMKLALLDESGMPTPWTEVKIERIIDWLVRDEYKQLYFERRPNVQYYAICTNEASLHTAVGQGYLDLQFRTNSPYPFLPAKEVVIDATSTPKFETVYCDSILGKYSPVVEIEKTGNTSGILNLYVNGRESETISFRNIPVPTTKIKIYTGQRIIKDITNDEFIYHLRNPLSGNEWFTLFNGENKIALSRGWKAKFTLQEPTVR